MKVPEFISRLNPLKGSGRAPQISEQEVTARRLEQIKQVKEKVAGQPPHLVNLDYLEKPAGLPAQTAVNLEKFDPDTRAKIEGLLKQRETLEHFTQVAGRHPTTSVKDAQEIAKIDAQLVELGINPTEASGKKVA